mmetsp:Transcript_85425/g.217763  ORF Transcript_85425/g.217763 Transcript_85425/m.217763 type:complete len:90 (-) Transcript_85425:745-1014(-)
MVLPLEHPLRGLRRAHIEVVAHRSGIGDEEAPKLAEDAGATRLFGLGTVIWGVTQIGIGPPTAAAETAAGAGAGAGPADRLLPELKCAA